MVFGMELTYYEIEKLLDMKNIDASTIGYTLSPSIYEIIDIKKTLKSLLPDEGKVNIFNDGTGLKSNPTTNKIIRFTKNLFLYHIKTDSITFSYFKR